MTRLVLNPPIDMRRVWGPLAYVHAEERERILALPPANRKYAIRQLERDVRNAMRKGGR